MSQVTFCDICHQPLAIGENKCLIAINVSPEANKEIKEDEYKAMLDSVFCQMQRFDRRVPLYEICGKCLAVFYYFIKIRTDELNKTQKEMDKILTKKAKTIKENK